MTPEDIKHQLIIIETELSLFLLLLLLLFFFSFFFFTRGGCVSCLRGCFGSRLMMMIMN